MALQPNNQDRVSPSWAGDLPQCLPTQLAGWQQKHSVCTKCLLSNRGSIAKSVQILQTSNPVTGFCNTVQPSYPQPQQKAHNVSNHACANQLSTKFQASTGQVPVTLAPADGCKDACCKAAARYVSGYCKQASTRSQPIKGLPPFGL